MKNKWFTFIFFGLVAASTIAQPSGLKFHSEFEATAFQVSDPMQILFASNPEVDLNKYKEYQSEVNSLIAKLSKKIDDEDLFYTLEKVFYYTHRKQLDWYEKYVSFSDVFESGKYDCLTGTALYAILLDSLNIPYNLYEFDYHVFLTTQIDGQNVLLEATEPLRGFITDPKEIDNRIAFYQEEGKKKTGVYITNDISLNELIGLQYMNLGIRSYNEGNVFGAIDFLQKAQFLYPSKRVKELHKTVSQQVMLVTSN